MTLSIRRPLTAPRPSRRPRPASDVPALLLAIAAAVFTLPWVLVTAVVPLAEDDDRSQ